MSRSAESATPMLFSSWSSWLLRTRASSSCSITRRLLMVSRARSRRRRRRAAVTGLMRTSSMKGLRRTTSSASDCSATQTSRARRLPPERTQASRAARSDSRCAGSASTSVLPLPSRAACRPASPSISSVVIPAGSSPAMMSRPLPQTRMLAMEGAQRSTVVRSDSMNAGSSSRRSKSVSGGSRYEAFGVEAVTDADRPRARGAPRLHVDRGVADHHRGPRRGHGLRHQAQQAVGVRLPRREVAAAVHAEEPRPRAERVQDAPAHVSGLVGEHGERMRGEAIEGVLHAGIEARVLGETPFVLLEEHRQRVRGGKRHSGVHEAARDQVPRPAADERADDLQREDRRGRIDAGAARRSRRWRGRGWNRRAYRPGRRR